MIALVLLVGASWLLLRFEHMGLDVLGFNAPGQRLQQFAAGFGIAALFALVQQVGLSAVSGVAWQLNADASVNSIARSLQLNVLSVLLEEFLFRGYLFYQAVRWLGAKRAIPLGAMAFGIYHWFTFGVVGNPIRWRLYSFSLAHSDSWSAWRS